MLLEGPPGTGKSQTIVNIIADAIGRRKSVLVVCQKLAAIDVVRKRLEKEGLHDRCVMVTDINKDRQRILQTIRDQALNLRRNPDSGSTGVNRRRQQLAHLIEELEGQLDRQHEAVHQVDEQVGVSYRALLGELIDLEAGGPVPIDVPRLRSLLGALPAAQRASIEEGCSSLARYWLPSNFEQSPLHALKVFQSDPATLQAFLTDLERFAAAEAQRAQVIAEGEARFEVNESEAARTWLSQASESFAELSGEQIGNVALWISLFAPTAQRLVAKPEGRSLIADLDALLILMGEPTLSLPPSELQGTMLAVDADTLSNLERAATRVSAPASILGRLSPSRFLSRRQLRLFMRDHAPAMGNDILPLLCAVRLECTLRKVKHRLSAMLIRLGFRDLVTDSKSWVEVHKLLHYLRHSLDGVATIGQMLERGPRSDLAFGAAELGMLPTFLKEAAVAIRRCDARTVSAAALDALTNWFAQAWQSECRAAIAQGQSNAQRLRAVTIALPTIEPFQEFRRRAANLDKLTLAVFGHLRAASARLVTLPGHQLAPMVRRIIAREARLAVKASLEAREPDLLFDQGDMNTKVRTLGAADQQNSTAQQ